MQTETRQRSAEIRPVKIFLTGDRQIGKSTIIKKILARLSGVSLGGYFTGGSGQDIFIYPAADSCAEGVAVGRRRQGGDRAAFDGPGTEILRSSQDADLILLDEIGWMERDAEVFFAEILGLAASDKNLLGVLRKGCDTPLCNALKAMPGLEIIEVTEANRDALAESLAERFLQFFADKHK